MSVRDEVDALIKSIIDRDVSTVTEADYQQLKEMEIEIARIKQRLVELKRAYDSLRAEKRKLLVKINQHHNPQL